MDHQPTNRRHRLLTVVAPLMTTALLAFGCGPAPAAREGSGASHPSSTAKTLTLGMRSEPSTIAQYGGSGTGSAQLEHFLMFHGNLTMYHPEDSVLAHLAQKVPTVEDGDWKILSNGQMEVTWKLRPNVFWHDGTPLSADDFVFGFPIAIDPELQTVRGELANVAEVQAPDRQTLIVIWKTVSIFGDSNSHQGVPALPRHIFGALYTSGDKLAFENSPYWNTEFVGLGPYRLTRWEIGSFIEATAFDQYFLGRPKIDRLVLRYLEDPNTLVANALAGTVDVISLGAILDVPQMVAVRQQWDARGVGGTTLAIPKGVRPLYLQFRDPTAPWVQDLRVRQALQHAIDRNTFIETLLSGVTPAADWFVAPNDRVYRLAEQRGLPRYPFDLARAERLLAQAGWTRGTDRLVRNAAGQTIHIDVTSSSAGGNVQETQAIAHMWSTAGFQSAPTPYTVTGIDATRTRHLSPGALIWPWNFSATAPGILQSSQIGTEPRWQGNNYGAYVNPTYDRLYDQFTTQLNMADRQETLFQIVKIIAEEIPVLGIFYTVNCLVARSGVEGPGMVGSLQPANTWNIHTWDIK